MMRHHLREKLTYANVVSTLCLFLVLGGGAAYAASHLAANSVGNAQLKKNAVSTAKIRNGAVTPAKLKSSAFTGVCPSGTEQVRLSLCGTVDPVAEAVPYFFGVSACASYGLRLPTLTEAKSIYAWRPQASGGQGTRSFWTEAVWVNGSAIEAFYDDAFGGYFIASDVSKPLDVYCVTTPA